MSGYGIGNKRIFGSETSGILVQWSKTFQPQKGFLQLQIQNQPPKPLLLCICNWRKPFWGWKFLLHWTGIPCVSCSKILFIYSRVELAHTLLFPNTCRVVISQFGLAVVAVWLTIRYPYFTERSDSSGQNLQQDIWMYEYILFIWYVPPHRSTYSVKCNKCHIDNHTIATCSSYC